jgi:AraC-like DNA-binding protein
MGLAALGLLGHLVANSESVAAALGLRRRTSARRLDEHGVSFHELLDEARFLAARNLLQISRVPVTEIAARLGYSDTPAFTRAFRRWAGTSPTEWRYRHRTIRRRRRAGTDPTQRLTAVKADLRRRG